MAPLSAPHKRISTHGVAPRVFHWQQGRRVSASVAAPRLHSLSSSSSSSSSFSSVTTLAELEALEETLSLVLLDVHMSTDVFRLLLSYFPDRAYLAACTFLSEAEIVATQTRSRGRPLAPLLYCSARTGKGVDDMWTCVTR
jgi:hypothetical protein